MARNPFEKLKINHDDDEDQPTTTQKQPSANLFQQPQEVKKKKIRPDDKKQNEVPTRHTPEDTEGFSEVKKKKLPLREGRIDNLIEAAVYQESSNAKPKKEYEQKPLREGKRQYERHSGTGRGNEISKQGAGGKTTWGNANEQAKQEARVGEDYYEEDYYNNQEDNLFNYAANTDFTHKKDDVVVDQQPKNEENYEKKEEGKEGKKKKKKFGEEEEKKETKIVLPDNSVSYQDYKLQMKQKSETGKIQEKKETFKSTIPQVDLKPKTKDLEEFEISTSGKQEKKKVNKVKEQKVDNLSERLNKIVSLKNVEIKEDKENLPKKYEKYDKGGKTQQKEKAFTYSKDAFPEL